MRADIVEAWENGHSFSYSEVFNFAQEYVELIR